ncbi:MAG: hypothetical protein ACOCQY_04015 [Halorhabdus sp.]
MAQSVPSSLPRRPVVALQALLSATTIVIAALSFSALPNPIPSWPTIGPIPVNPELLVPGSLAIVTLAVCSRDGPSVGTVATGALAIGTGFLAVISWHALFVGTAGGVFWGGFFTLLAGVALSATIAVRHAIRLL